MKQYNSIFYTSDYDTAQEIKQLFNQFKVTYRLYNGHRLEPEFASISYVGTEAVFQVIPSDYFKAHHLLVSRGYKSAYEKDKDTFGFLNKLYIWLADKPVLNKLSKPFIFYLLFSLLFFVPILLLTVKSGGFSLTFSLTLENTDWCIVELIHKNEVLDPKPDLIFHLDAKCHSSVKFHTSNAVQLPGGKTGNWKYASNKQSLTITMNRDTSSLYSGFYQVKRNWFRSEYILESEHTFIRLRQVNW